MIVRVDKEAPSATTGPVPMIEELSTLAVGLVGVLPVPVLMTMALLPEIEPGKPGAGKLRLATLPAVSDKTSPF